MNVKVIGESKITWQDDYNSGIDYNYIPLENHPNQFAKNPWNKEISQSFIIKAEDMTSIPRIQYSPQMLSIHTLQYLKSLVLKSQNIEYLETQKVYKVTQVLGEKTVESDNSTEPPTPENPNPEPNPEKQVKEGKTITETITINDEPILSYYKLKDTGGNSKLSLYESVLLMMIISGDVVEDNNVKGSYRLVGDTQESKKLYSLSSTLANQVLARIKNGQITVKVPSKTLNISYTTDKPDTSLASKVGKITVPQGTSPEMIQGYKTNWLMASYSVSKIAKKNYRVEESYILSQPGGFNAELYN